MTVRLRIALTLLATGLLTALCVIATVVFAFQRFERETSYDRADMFLGRVVSMYDNLLEVHERRPEESQALLRNLLLFEQDTQLYLLDAQGRVLVHTGQAKLAPEFRVAMAPVRQAAQAASRGLRAAYVMGDDPERMELDAVVAARALNRTATAPGDAQAGYLYLVCHKPLLAAGRLEIFRSAIGGPALAAVAAVVAVATLLALWIVSSVTRPLQRLSADVARATRDGLAAADIDGAELALAPSGGFAAAPERMSKDEFMQLRLGFSAMLAALRRQWQTLHQMDSFRREGVSNLSHDLRSPLTATVACLETLQQRWSQGGAPSGAESRTDSLAEDRRLVEVALRNTRNAAQLVHSLGDLALLDEPSFQMRAQRLDVGELLDDIALRFHDRAGQRGVSLRCEHVQGVPDAPPLAAIDVELFERAIANLIDNALKYTPAGGEVVLRVGVSGGLAASGSAGASGIEAAQVLVSVRDNGSGMAAHDLEHLFERFYRGRDEIASRLDAAPAPSDGGKGLGLAIVKRIVELHGGSVTAVSAPGQGTEINMVFPRGLP